MTYHNEKVQRPKVSYSARIKQSIDEKVPFLIKGQWIDVLKYKDGRVEERKGLFEWRPNQIQNTFATLLASWCRAESGYDRIGFMALGTGLVSWDSAFPSQPYSQTTLTTEAFRKAIPQADIIFIDPTTDVPTGGTPSSKLEITVNILSSEANGLSLREFGLFGGTATITTDSGQMVNWVVHSRIDKDSSFELQRKVRLEFVTL